METLKIYKRCYTFHQMIKIIGFDLIGTLVSEDKFLEEVDKVDERLIKKYKIPANIQEFNHVKYRILKKFEKLPDKEKTKPTKFYEMCFDELKVKVNKRILNKLQKDFDRIYIQKLKLVKGTRRTLSRLKKKHKLVLITNTIKSRVNSILRKFKLKKYFDLIITPEKFGTKKNLKSMEFVLKKFKIKPKEFLMVGNSMKEDIKPAKRINAKYIRGNIKQVKVKLNKYY